MIETKWLNAERAAETFPNIGASQFNKLKKEFVQLWEEGYYPRECYLQECNGIEIKAFVHFLAWRPYYQNKNLKKEIDLYKSVWQSI